MSGILIMKSEFIEYLIKAITLLLVYIFTPLQEFNVTTIIDIFNHNKNSNKKINLFHMS